MNEDETEMATLPAGHVLITPRDLALLESLYDNIAMTFSQLAVRHFANARKPTVINRLSKLERAGFLRRERIPRMTLGLDAQAIGVVYQITRDGIRVLKERRSGKEFKAQPIRIHPCSLHHDLILVDVAAALERKFPGAKIVNGRLVQNGAKDGKSLEPDLVLAWPNVQGAVAVELELNDKSERRYREIVLRYRLAQAYPKVLYLVARPDIQRLLTRVILNRPPHASEIPRTGKFYFAPAFEFLSRPQEVAISNGVDDIGQKGGGH